LKQKKEIVIYTLICLIITNILWYIGYGLDEKNEGNIISLILIYLASFIPAILALIMCKINKAKVKTLLISPNLKKSWKIYLIAILTGLIMVYSTDIIPLLFYPKDVVLLTENFSILFICKILLFIIISILGSVIYLGEELGWMGYLFPKLEKQKGTILSIIIIAIIRTLWHIGIFLRMDNILFAITNLFISNLVLQSILVYFTKKSNSVFPSAIIHSITNLMIGLSFVSYTEEFYNANAIQFSLIGLIPLLIIGTIFLILIIKDRKKFKNFKAD